MCGKDRLDGFKAVNEMGSPPRVREGHQSHPVINRRLWITPAYAGRTQFQLQVLQFLQDHPRSRGKDLNLVIFIKWYLGSPPLAREGPKLFCTSNICARITPACAGRTQNYAYKKGVDKDHPRMCGKDDYMRVGQGLLMGSPPHVREGLFVFTFYF